MRMSKEGVTQLWFSTVSLLGLGWFITNNGTFLFLAILVLLGGVATGWVWNSSL